MHLLSLLRPSNPTLLFCNLGMRPSDHLFQIPPLTLALLEQQLVVARWVTDGVALNLQSAVALTTRGISSCPNVSGWKKKRQ